MRYLVQRGWQMLRSKFRVGRSSEIDLVMLDPDGVTVFIEVKTRTLARAGEQLDWHESVSQTIDWRKKKKIMAAARCYKIETANYGSACRFDVVMLGLSSGLAAELVRVANSTVANYDCDEIEREASRLLVETMGTQSQTGLSHQAGTRWERARLIHCESVFVTNF